LSKTKAEEIELRILQIERDIKEIKIVLGSVIIKSDSIDGKVDQCEISVEKTKLELSIEINKILTKVIEEVNLLIYSDEFDRIIH